MITIFLKIVRVRQNKRHMMRRGADLTGRLYFETSRQEPQNSSDAKLNAIAELLKYVQGMACLPQVQNDKQILQIASQLQTLCTKELECLCSNQELPWGWYSIFL
ncbi:hypothetical protein EZS27_005353 [termite gut metagenome]|uniref:Uncharacterized protein n=1 Tax=termite gut metagenome TaxID=433724 RepID=A0A5J4SLT5_9ZZZZ